LVVGIAVAEKQNQLTIVIIVKKLQAPAAHKPCRLADARPPRDVVESFVMVVLVNRVAFHIYIGYEQIHPAVLVEVGRIYTHARAGSPLRAVSHTGRLADFFKSAPTPLHEKEVGNGIIADKKIHAPIIVQICGNRAPRLAEILANSRSLADVGKSSIAIVMKQPTGCRLIHVRNAISALGIFTGPAIFAYGFRELDKLAYK